MQDWIYQLSRMVETDFEQDIESTLSSLRAGLFGWITAEGQNPVAHWHNAAEKPVSGHSEALNIDR